jgi:hypothetical protein
MLLQRLCSPLRLAIPAPARMQWSARARKGEDRASQEIAIRFDFAGASAQNLSLSERESFRADFRRELASLQTWLARWQDPLTTPIPELHVLVSDAYKISRALVPAWERRSGVLEFPSWRVVSRKAAILHELSHVYLPNGNRFLAEGLATYLQALLGGNPAFPNFGRSLHGLARDSLLEIVSGKTDALASVQLAELDATPTPNPLALAAARRRYERQADIQAAIYAVVGSFVEFLIESQGLERFQKLYRTTPLIPGRLGAGAVERWSEIYGRTLADLEAEWKSLIVGMRQPEAPNGRTRPRRLA